MSDTMHSALDGARYEGFATIEEAGLQGMVTLRGDLADAALTEAVREVTGVAVPGRREIATAGDGRAAAWMAPDELLLLMAHADAGAAVARLRAALADSAALVVEVSDARALFRVRGAAARDVLAKLCPVDFAAFAPGEIRRTRCAQVAAAVWMSGEDEFSLVCFRSVARYVFDVLCLAARPGGEVGYA